MPVFINNLQDRVNFDEVNSKLVEKAVEVVLELEDFKEEDPEVSISLVDDEYIRELNRNYRQKDCSTDVLSFPLLDDEEDDLEEGEEEPELLLGDIIISLETAMRQAVEYGHTPEREVAFLTVHGMLHLLGHDHYEEDETLLMRSREKEAMDILKLSR